MARQPLPSYLCGQIHTRPFHWPTVTPRQSSSLSWKIRLLGLQAFFSDSQRRRGVSAAWGEAQLPANSDLSWRETVTIYDMLPSTCGAGLRCRHSCFNNSFGWNFIEVRKVSGLWSVLSANLGAGLNYLVHVF